MQLLKKLGMKTIKFVSREQLEADLEKALIKSDEHAGDKGGSER